MAQAGHICQVEGSIDGHPIAASRPAQHPDVGSSALFHHLLDGESKRQLKVLRHQRDGAGDLFQCNGLHGALAQANLPGRGAQNPGNNT